MPQELPVLDGEPPITLTPRAVAMGKAKLQKWGDGAFAIRIGVKGGGCSGMSYVFDFVKKVRDGKDFTMEFDGLTVVSDYKSIELLRGSVLDWSDDLVNNGFRWKNPNAKGGCGCGESFST